MYFRNFLALFKHLWNLCIQEIYATWAGWTTNERHDGGSTNDGRFQGNATVSKEDLISFLTFKFLFNFIVVLTLHTLN